MRAAGLLAAELLGIGLVGDGIVTLLAPRRHLRRWQIGPNWWRDIWARTERDPWLRAGVVAAKLGIGAAIVIGLPTRTR